jgi:hypothetical protein
VRISEVLATRIAAAIEALPVLSVVREGIDWEIAPALLPRGGGMVLAYMVAVSLPVPGSAEGDNVLYVAPLDDPHASQEAVSDLVEALYLRAQRECDDRRAAITAHSNGHRESPGGLALP